MLPQLSNQWQKYASLPQWRRYLAIAGLVLAITYLLWCKFGTKPPAPGETVSAPVAHQIEDMPQKQTPPIRVVVIKDKERAAEKLNIPPSMAPNGHEEIFQASAVPKLKNGGTATTFINTSTGKGRTIITANPQPWFAFERGSAVGVEYGMGSRGNYYRGDYRRDILQIKGVFLSGKAEVEQYDQRIEGKAGARLEYRW